MRQLYIVTNDLKEAITLNAPYLYVKIIVENILEEEAKRR